MDEETKQIIQEMQNTFILQQKINSELDISINKLRLEVYQLTQKLGEQISESNRVDEVLQQQINNHGSELNSHQTAINNLGGF
jgi:hypothetical protein